MKTIAVLAYTGNNVGDDLFLSLLHSRYPEAELAILAPSWDRLLAFRNTDRIRLINSQDFGRQVHSFDAFVVIGGSMFQQVPGWWRGWLSLARRVRACRSNRVPMFVLGASFGPWRSRSFRLAYTALLRQFAWVSVRDQQSATVLRSARARLHPDLAFALRIPHRMVAPSLVGVSVMEFGPASGFATYEADMTRVVALLARSCEVRLFSFQTDTDIDDARAAGRVLDGLDPNARERVTIVPYSGDLEATLGSISECRAFLATRLHSMVVAALSGAEVGIIAYHPKIGDLIDTTRLGVTMWSPKELHERVEAIAESIVTGSLPVVSTPLLAGLAAGADGHFAGLDALLADSATSRS